MLPLLTLYSLSCVEKGIVSPDDLTLRPEKIVKQRVRHGVPCLEILWQIDGEFNCRTVCLCLQCASLARLKVIYRFSSISRSTKAIFKLQKEEAC